MVSSAQLFMEIFPNDVICTAWSVASRTQGCSSVPTWVLPPPSSLSMWGSTFWFVFQGFFQVLKSFVPFRWALAWCHFLLKAPLLSSMAGRTSLTSCPQAHQVIISPGSPGSQTPSVDLQYSVESLIIHTFMKGPTIGFILFSSQSNSSKWWDPNGKGTKKDHQRWMYITVT